MKKIITTLVLTLTLISLYGCHKNDYEVIKIVATSVPHEEVLIEAIPLLNERGYTLDITVISDYSIGNPAVSNGSADANYFQHLPYLNAFNQSVDSTKQLISVLGVHIEPIGLYGSNKSTLDTLSDGDKIIISDNASDYGRIIQFLVNLELVTAKEGFNSENTYHDPEEAIESKKVNFSFQIIEAALLVQAQKNKEGAFIFINGNYALEGNLSVSERLYVESAEDNPFVNVLAVRKGTEDDLKIKALIEVLSSETIKAFITTRYGGAVIPA
ncbi:MAG: MetQ/NlpA family ABC transporter substrate-binding protein [Acholeplasma sp.]|nr:MetQ/NlpA family ABC transporter substrate-binding protein [Acholeplasma sp.]